jgi:hypothetical protein
MSLLAEFILAKQHYLMVSVIQTVFWGVTPCTLQVGTGVSEEHGASIFSVEVWVSFVP